MMNLAQFINQCGSVAEACRQLKVVRQTMDRWQYGDSSPSPAMIELAAQKGVDLSYVQVVPRKRAAKPE